MNNALDQAALRRSMYRLIIFVALAMACGRILCAQLVLEPSVHRREGEPPEKGRVWPKSRPTPMPTFGSNDRSRWATVHSLVHDGTYAIGRRDRDMAWKSAVSLLGLTDLGPVTADAFVGYQLRTGKIANTGITFEDGWQSVDKVLDPGTYKFYSSKPPLLATLIAGLYWLLNTLFGWTLDTHPFLVVRTILVLVNVGAFWLFLHWLTGLVERFGKTDWAKAVVLVAGAFGTLLTPFLITLNNHTLGAVCVMGALTHGIRVWDGVAAAWLNAVGCGLWSALAVTMEMPALAVAAALFVVLFLHRPRSMALFALPTALVVAAAFFFTNYLAVGTWRPVNTDFGSPWYSFEGSHFRRPNPGEIPPGIDFARYKETRGEYAFHLLLGHHGWFSLTPIWLLVLLSPFTFRARDEAPKAVSHPAQPWWLVPLTLFVSLVVFAFYLWKTDNYGGWTIGPRWLMWLTPLWLVCLLPVVDWLGQWRWGRCFVYLCLGVSILSVHYSLWNPWRHPWIYNLMLACGWEGY